jgi:predicted permease
MGQALVAALETSNSRITLPLGLDWRVLGFAAGLALTTVLLFGLAPALRGTRMAATAVMRASTRGATAARGTLSLRRALVVVQIALSVALLFGSLLFARTLHNAASVDPGFTPDGLLVASVNSTQVGIPEERRASYRLEVVERIRAVPGVQSAAIASIIPITGDAAGNDIWPEGNPSQRFNMLNNSVGPGYFATMGLPLLAGRDFDARDVPSSVPVAIVDERLAARLGGSHLAVGRRFTREATPGGPEKTFEVIGIVGNSSYASLKEEPYPVVYYAALQGRASRFARILIRSSLPPASATAAITAALTGLDRRLEVTYAMMPTIIRDTLVQERLLAGLSGGFGALAALLTMVGLYGLVAYSVTRRTGEIGIRMALGATPANIARLLLGETGVLLAIGAASGIGLALAGGRAASALLFRVTPYDPLTLAIAVGLLAAIALVASYGPARRATRIQPVVALRVD